MSRRRRRIISPLISLGIIGGEDDDNGGGGEEPPVEPVGVWDISNPGTLFRYDISAQATVAPYAICFNDDGSKGYISGRNSASSPNNYLVYQYSLDDAYQFKTGGVTYDNKSFNNGTTNEAYTNALWDMQWIDGGNSLVYAVGSTNIYQAFASTPYDVSTLSQATVVKKAVSTFTFYGFFIDKTGTRLYVFDVDAGLVKEYSMSTANDISTITYTNRSLNVNATIADKTNVGLDLSPDLRKMFITNFGGERCYQFSLGETGNVDTGTYDNVSLLLDPAAVTTGINGTNFGDGNQIVASVNKDDNVEIVTFPLLES